MEMHTPNLNILLNVIKINNFKKLINIQVKIWKTNILRYNIYTKKYLIFLNAIRQIKFFFFIRFYLKVIYFCLVILINFLQLFKYKKFNLKK